jgi:hypothetical protein
MLSSWAMWGNAKFNEEPTKGTKNDVIEMAMKAGITLVWGGFKVMVNQIIIGFGKILIIAFGLIARYQLFFQRFLGFAVSKPGVYLPS